MPPSSTIVTSAPMTAFMPGQHEPQHRERSDIGGDVFKELTLRPFWVANPFLLHTRAPEVSDYLHRLAVHPSACGSWHRQSTKSLTVGSASACFHACSGVSQKTSSISSAWGSMSGASSFATHPKSVSGLSANA